MGNIRVLHVTRLKLFVGTREEAYKAAPLDADPFVITRIHYWRGNPEKRSEMFFYLEFDDGDKVLLPCGKSTFSRRMRIESDLLKDFSNNFCRIRLLTTPCPYTHPGCKLTAAFV